MMQTLEAMLTATGKWVELATWNANDYEYDAGSWLDKWGERIGGGIAMLPTGGYVNLSPFCAIREKPE